jgi:hypothetical protein
MSTSQETGSKAPMVPNTLMVQTACLRRGRLRRPLAARTAAAHQHVRHIYDEERAHRGEAESAPEGRGGYEVMSWRGPVARRRSGHSGR